MKFTTTQLIFGVIIIFGVLFAWYLIGDVALGGLLALFGLNGLKDHKQAEKLNTEADLHGALADNLAKEATDKQQAAAKVDQEIDKIIEAPVDYEKPMQEVVDDAKKDWT